MKTKRAVLLFILCSLSTGAAADWPDFHGPRRDNLSDETGLLKRWPEGGPRLLWTARGLGHGFSTVAIADGLIYTTGNIGDDTVITALDLEGQKQWTAKNGPADRHDRPGARSTPVVHAGRLYHENSVGDVVCLDARSGKKLWSVNILGRFQGRNNKWGLSESPLVIDDKVICVPGGQRAGIVALDRQTGATRWVCTETDEKPGYASPVLIEFGGVRQVVTMMQRSVVSVSADTGKLLWRLPHNAYADETASTPVFEDGYIVVSTLPAGSTQCIRLRAEGGRIVASKAWQQRSLSNHHGGVLVVDGYVYGSDYRGAWLCLELQTGRVSYSAKGVGKGSLTYADGMLITLSEKGEVGLVEATPTGHRVISRFQLPAGGKGPVWAHPVVCGGRLYIRHGDRLYYYLVSA